MNSYSVCASLFAVPEGVTIGTEIMLDPPRNLLPMGTVAEGKLSPIAVISIPPRAPDNLVPRPRMAVTTTLARFCSHTFFGSMVSFPVPDILDHKVTVKVCDIIRMVHAAVQFRPDEEAFSFRVCHSHDCVDRKNLQLLGELR